MVVAFSSLKKYNFNYIWGWVLVFIHSVAAVKDIIEEVIKRRYGTRVMHIQRFIKILSFQGFPDELND